MTENLVWIDCEMTGLDPQRDCLVEIAVVVTNSDLELLHPGLDVVIKPRQDSLEGMNDFVRNMHTTSGLINEFDSGVSVEEAEKMVLEYIQQWVPTEKSAPLAGNSIGTDRMFLNRYMPILDNFLHYRNIDVSSIKELTRRWFPTVYFKVPKKDSGHRALADILESISELRFYRKVEFVESALSNHEIDLAIESLGK
jgi:oligoribonuclease